MEAREQADGDDAMSSYDPWGKGVYKGVRVDTVAAAAAAATDGGGGGAGEGPPPALAPVSPRAPQPRPAPAHTHPQRRGRRRRRLLPKGGQAEGARNVCPRRTRRRRPTSAA